MMFSIYCNDAIVYIMLSTSFCIFTDLSYFTVCVAPPAPGNGTVTTAQYSKDYETFYATQSCNDGFEKSGGNVNGQILCYEDGNWSESIMCTQIKGTLIPYCRLHTL